MLSCACASVNENELEGASREEDALLVEEDSVPY